MAHKPILRNVRKLECIEEMHKWSDITLCEAVQAHFTSHPTLPGERSLKDMVNQMLAILNTPNGVIAENDRNNLIERFAETRIRETPLRDAASLLDFRNADPKKLKRTPLGTDASIRDGRGGIGTVYMDLVPVLLMQTDTQVAVLAEQIEAPVRVIGYLPDKFLINNPMNLEYCRGEVQLTDYSNGEMKNLSARLVVDTDVLSGDIKRPL